MFTVMLTATSVASVILFYTINMMISNTIKEIQHLTPDVRKIMLSFGEQIDNLTRIRLISTLITVISGTIAISSQSPLSITIVSLSASGAIVSSLQTIKLLNRIKSIS